jgi:type IV secretion system protein VirD4
VIGWGGGSSFEERAAEIAVGVLVALFALAMVVWAAAELAGLLSHGAWPPLGPADAPGVAWSLLQHPADPAAGWPPAARRMAPPAWAYYALLVLFVAGIAAAGLAIASRLLRSSDYRAAGPVPGGLARWPRQEWQERPFLGWTGIWPLRRMVLGSSEDCVAVIGPPRVGKTQGVLIPQALLWGGSLVSASTKPDVLEATARRRQQLAAAHGGRVALWAPTVHRTLPDGVEAVGWSPLAGCEIAETCERRVRALVGASGAGTGARHEAHWRENAIRLLRGYFHAAAVQGLGVRDVLRWLARNELKEPALTLERTGTLVGESWAQEVEGMQRVPSEELGSIFSAARTALGALQNGQVLASCESPSQIDADEFLQTRSTLYLIEPTADQNLLAPLAAALVEHLVQRAYELWDQGQLPARELLDLDELVNIAPLPTLLKILTQGGSQGVNLTWSVQSLAQFRDFYGEQVADAAFSSSRARLVFGGLMDTRDLQAISQLAGEHEVPARSHTRGVQAGQASATVGTIWRPRLAVSAIRGIPSGRVMLLYHTSDPALVRVQLAHRMRFWRRLARSTAASPQADQPGWGRGIRDAAAAALALPGRWLRG